MPNDYLSVLYKHLIQVENENVGLKHTIAPQSKTWPPPPPPSPASYAIVW